MFVNNLFSEMHHHFLSATSFQNNTYTWKKEGISPFQELLISWNAFRPSQGYYSIYVRVQTESWSPWLLYATWGSNFQKGSSSHPQGAAVRVYQDAVETLRNQFGNAFEIKVLAEKGASLSHLKSIHVCSSNLETLFLFSPKKKRKKSYLLEVPCFSQMEIPDERNIRLCSPTSTSAVVEYIQKQNRINPLEFADHVWDETFDIYGNWVFNVAEAFHQIQDTRYSCWVERLKSFDSLLDSLKKGFPVVISIRGPLPNSALPYKEGHLLVVIGYDHKTKEVICMDPAFSPKEKTKVRYKLKDLTKAWKRRKNVAYIFEC